MKDTKKILVAGDSFAADWSVKYTNYPGWPALLANNYNVTNIAQAGVSEFKIYQQICSVDLEEYDVFIISHTSPYRVATRTHPVHANDALHQDADLLYSDTLYHSSRIKNYFNAPLRTAINFFKYHYNEEFFTTTYMLLRAEINKLLADKKVIVLSSLKIPSEYVTESIVLDFTNLLLSERGIVNHYTEKGNQIIYNAISNELSKLLEADVTGQQIKSSEVLR